MSNENSAKSAISNGKSLSKKNGSNLRTRINNMKKSYLIAYNLLQTVGWTFIFYQFISYFFGPKTNSLYETIRFSLIFFQNAAILEVFHAASGMVKTSAILTAFQVASRVAVLSAILLGSNDVKESSGFPLALIAWSVTEIIRYSTYTLSLMNSVPYFLKYLRYTLFIILYPIGVTGELLCIYAAQEEAGKKYLYSMHMPNQFNFIFNYQHLLWFLMFLYAPLFPQLYLHMFSQRKKALIPNKTDKAN